MSKIKKEILNKLKEYANKMGRDHLGGDDYTSKKRGGLRDFDGYDNVDYNKDMPMDEGKIPQPIQNLIGDMVKNKIQSRTVTIKNPTAFKRFMKDVKPAIKDKLLSLRTNPINKDEVTISLGPKASSKMFEDMSMDEGMFSTIDQIRQDSKDVRDFVKKVFADRDFKDMKNDKDFVKYLKSIYEGVQENIEEALPQNWMQGRTSDYHTKLRGKKREYDDTNFEKEDSGQPDIEEGFDKVEHLQLLNKALRAMPGSQKQKDIIRKLNKVRKAGGMRPLKEKSIVEYASKLTLSYLPADDLDETAKRDYKAEYKKFQSSTKAKKYRAELNKYNRQKGTYGNGDGKDASHKGGKIVGFESQSKNRGRREKSRLKKESVTINEIGVFPITNYMSGIVPDSFINTTTPKKKEKLKSTLRDLKNTLNRFWKQHNIPYRIK